MYKPGKRQVAKGLIPQRDAFFNEKGYEYTLYMGEHALLAQALQNWLEAEKMHNVGWRNYDDEPPAFVVGGMGWKFEIHRTGKQDTAVTYAAFFSKWESTGNELTLGDDMNRVMTAFEMILLGFDPLAWVRELPQERHVTNGIMSRPEIWEGKWPNTGLTIEAAAAQGLTEGYLADRLNAMGFAAKGGSPLAAAYNVPENPMITARVKKNLEREEQARLEAEQKRREEEQARLEAEQKRREEEQARMEEERKRREEEQARLAAEQKRREEEQARLAAEQEARKHCANCGAELKPGAKFCHRCGTAVAAMAEMSAEGLADSKSAESKPAEPSAESKPAEAPAQSRPAKSPVLKKYPPVFIVEVGESLDPFIHARIDENKNLILEPQDHSVTEVQLAGFFADAKRDGQEKYERVVSSTSNHDNYLYVTDSRIALINRKYNKQEAGGWHGYGSLSAMAVASLINAGEKAIKAAQRKDKSMAGHIRYEWINVVAYRRRQKMMEHARVRILYRDLEKTLWNVTLELTKDTDPERLANDILRRVAAYHAAMKDTADNGEKMNEFIETYRSGAGRIPASGDPDKFSFVSVPEFYFASKGREFRPEI